MNGNKRVIGKMIIILGIVLAISNIAVITASAEQFMTLPVADKSIEI